MSLRTWRGDQSTKIPFTKHSYITPENLAKEVNAYEKGSVTYFYCTSDGGFNINYLYDLVPRFNSHVEVVSHNNLINLALTKDRLSKHD